MNKHAEKLKELASPKQINPIFRREVTMMDWVREAGNLDAGLLAAASEIERLEAEVENLKHERNAAALRERQRTIPEFQKLQARCDRFRAVVQYASDYYNGCGYVGEMARRALEEAI